MIKRIQARIFCLAHGLKVLNLCILFLLLSQIGLVTRQLKYLISFANSYILIEAASVHDRCCQDKQAPAAASAGPSSAPFAGLQTNTAHRLTLCFSDFHIQEKGVSFGITYRENIFSDVFSSLKKLPVCGILNPLFDFWFKTAQRFSFPHPEGK